MKTPPGVGALAFGKALQEFANVVGTQWVFSRDEDTALYNDAFSPLVREPDKQPVASAAVSPTTVQQVQQVVRIANKYRIPLYAVSTGRNLGYGGSSPNLSGSVIVDLKRMNRILEVNEREGYVIVEPGVSFMELKRHFDDNHIDYALSSPAPGWGSLIGNALDHGVGFVYGDNFSAVKGMEVVLANGEVLRTGRGALPDPKLWPLYPYGLGPDLRGLFAQGNLGIVTQACFWIVPNWEVSRSFSINSPHDEDLDPMIDALNDLANHEVIGGFGLGSPLRASTGTNDGRRPFGPPEAKALLRRRDGGSSAEWTALALKTGIALANGGGGIRGPRPIVQAKLDYALDYLKRKKVPGTVEVGMERSGPTPITIDFGALAIQGNNLGHYYFSPILKRSREDLFGINEVIRNVFIDVDDMEMLDEFGFFGAGGGGSNGAAQGKHMVLLMEFLVHDDAEKNARRRDLFRRLVKACGQKGWAEYRAPIIFQDDAQAEYSFNNHAYRRFVETLYDAVDPNGILSPGRMGIWPKHLRRG
jgi:4-cresol dehydrogenase (hydroxylating)